MHTSQINPDYKHHHQQQPNYGNYNLYDASSVTPQSRASYTPHASSSNWSNNHSSSTMTVPKNSNPKSLSRKSITESKALPSPSSTMKGESQKITSQKMANASAIRAMLLHGLPKTTEFRVLKNQHILLFIRQYYLGDRMVSPLEFERYFPNQMAQQFPTGASLRLRLVKIKNAKPGSNDLDILGFDNETESGINYVKNCLESETKFAFETPQPKMKPFEAKVEEIPIRHNQQKPEFVSHQQTFEIKKAETSPKNASIAGSDPKKTYHSFTILPKTRTAMNARQKRFYSQEEMLTDPFPTKSLPSPFRGNHRSPDVYVVEEKVSKRCPSAEVASSFPHDPTPMSTQTPIFHRTPAANPWQPLPSPSSSQSIQTAPLNYPATRSYGKSISRQPSFTQSQPTPPTPSFQYEPPPPSYSSQEWRAPSCEDLLNEIKSEVAFFEANQNHQPQLSNQQQFSNNQRYQPYHENQRFNEQPLNQHPGRLERPSNPQARSLPSVLPSEHGSPPYSKQMQPPHQQQPQQVIYVSDQNKHQVRGSAKRKESTRTMCNGAKAIVSYFALDTNGTRGSKQRRTASPFSELNAPMTAVP